MLYDSTKALLQSILRSLETTGEIRWDEHTESGNACLYEMHQMSRPLYKAYRTDKQNANSDRNSPVPGDHWRNPLGRAYGIRQCVSVRNAPDVAAPIQGLSNR